MEIEVVDNIPNHYISIEGTTLLTRKYTITESTK